MSKQLGDQCTGEFNRSRERRLVTTGIPQVERRADERIGCWNHNSRRRGSVYKFRDKSKVEYDSPTCSPVSSEAYSRIPRSPRNAATSNCTLSRASETSRNDWRRCKNEPEDPGMSMIDGMSCQPQVSIR